MADKLYIIPFAIQVAPKEILNKVCGHVNLK
jgi:hypothetical protein